jgi:flagellar biosynthesis/type III secretory pathway protein FliH
MNNNEQKQEAKEEYEKGFREAIRAGFKDGSFARALAGKESLPSDVCKVDPKIS